jgi:Aspartyl protease
MRIIFCTLVFIQSFNARAQEILSKPKAQLLTRFPFKIFSGGVMVLQANLGNIKDTFNFILDTGSGGISLDSATCAAHHIKTIPSDTSITGVTGIRKVPFVFDQTLHFQGLDVHHLNFHVNDYDILSSVYGEKVDGVIGYSFFSRYIIRVDFDSAAIEVYSPGEIKYENGGHLLHPIFTALPIQWATVKDRRKLGFNFYMDTGAGLCFLLNEEFVKDSNIILSRRTPVLTQAEGIGGRIQMRLTVVKKVKLGPFVFVKVPTYLYTDSFNVTSYPFVGGLIGNDLLRRFNITFNYPAHEIHLLPNSHFRDPFDYMYTGMGIYYENGKVVVEDVIPNSPADKAGIMIGDVVFGLANNFSNNIMTYKNILQTKDEKIKIIVMREGKPLQLTLNPISIL